MSDEELSKRLDRYMKKRNDKKGRKRIIEYWKIPHIRTTVIIGFTSLVSLAISGVLFLIDAGFWSSVFANLFAGLVTGVVICLISGIKQMSVVKLKIKKEWLCELAEQLKKYFLEYHKISLLRFEKFDCENIQLFDNIYTLACAAKDINNYICQSCVDKTLPFDGIEYCKDKFDYDARSMCKAFQKLHNNAHRVDVDCPSSDTIKNYFMVVNIYLKRINKHIYSSIRDLEVQIAEIEKSVI